MGAQKLEVTPISKPVGIESTALVGFVDVSCFEAYFGFGGRSFADAEATAGASIVSALESATGIAALPETVSQ